MATIYKCDGCDKEFKEKRNNLTEITIERRMPGNDDRYAVGNQSTELDLCSRCQMTFERFLKSLREDREGIGTE
jgi:DNA-directed RNA polymerase subunit RPC12/RpoP